MPDPDTILIIAGRAHEIWRGKSKAQLAAHYAPDLLAACVEVTAGAVSEGDAWDGAKFVAAGG